MALLVILGIAVYGGSAFAEEAQEQADSASVTFSKDYIYLDPTGMNLNSDADWTKPSSDPNKPNVYLGYIPSGQSTTTFSAGCYNPKLQCWEWRLSDLNIANGTIIFFTYTQEWSNIDTKDYYRTEDFTLTGDKDTIGGNIYSQNGDSSKSYKAKAYALKTLKSNAGSKLTFVDMTVAMSGVKAQFSYSKEFSNNEELKDVDLTDNGAVTVPADNGKNMYRYMRFINEKGEQLTDPIKIEDALDKGGILYYGTVSNDSLIQSVWSKDKKNSSAPTITKLYFDKNSFGVNDSIQVKIGNGKYENVSVDSKDNTILSYDLTGKTLSSDTIIEVEKGNITYRFYPNGNLSFVTIDSDGNAGLSIYRNNSSGTYTVYFDATLSELSYAGDVDDKSLPKNGESVWCFAWNESENKSQAKVLEKDNSKKGSVYKVDLNALYPNIMFYSSNSQNTGLSIDGMKNLPSNSACTYNLTIPWSSLNNPCFYADSSDDSIYNSTKRSGYWDEVGTVRNAEGKTKDGAKTEKSIVDVAEGTYTRDNDKLYVNTTLYDYYSDYELNGYNRDNYQTVSIYTDRIYQPFRQLDQALSDYYKSNGATDPLYTGNFQNYDSNGSTHFSQIAGSLNLFGYDSSNTKKFYYENNSMWGIDGNELNTSQSATQGLVAQQLKDNHLQIKTESGTVLSPYFNEDFLNGNNLKNAVLGKVYNDVSFPFIKESKKSSTDTQYEAEYWVFDSAKEDAANKNLQLKRDASTGKYFLQSTEEGVHGQTAEKNNNVTPNANYFPLNTSAQSGNACKLNYGFGQKFDLKFKLTDDGTVVGKNPNNQADTQNIPIEFNFSGDDDVWVFIDGKLVLDVGGGHGVVSGTINFNNKKATVYGVKNSAGQGRVDSKEYDFSEILPNADNTKEHTLTMFYMERGLWESNMSISFNFPDENEFQVEKNVDTTDVAEDFKSYFDNVSAFPFTILNQATHYAEKEATGGQEIKNKTFNNEFKGDTISKKLETNTFKYLETCRDEEDKGTAKSDVVHWKAESSDDGTYKDLRWGIIYPSSGKGNKFNATYTIGKSTTNHYKYLQFSLYDGVVTETPSLNNMYIELEDSSNNKIGGFLSAGNTYNSLNLKKGKWNTITIDLDKLSKITTAFDFSKIVNIKFDYNLSRDMYLDDFIFIPSAEVTQPTGFVTKQYEIPDYGSVKSGTLMYPVNAVYTVSSGSSSTTNLLGADGTFTLANGETATFADQFRRGSYIALSEDVDTEVFEPSWTLYENGEEVKSIVSANSKTVTQAEQVTLPPQNGQALKDGRKENYDSGEDSDGKEKSNSGYTTTGWAKKNGTTSSDTDRDESNTIVFRSFTNPDSSTTATKLEVKYTNKVKTGTIRIVKAGAYSSDNDENLNGEYQIKVTFTNIAGMALENGKAYEKIYKLKLGEHVDMTGIPAGTEYTISEILPEDGSSLDDIAITQPTYSGEESKYTATKVKDSSGNWVVHGKIKADSTAAETVFTFKNTKKPVINLTVKKEWEGTKNNTNLPDSVTVKLQRRVKDTTEAAWKDVSVTDSEGNETTVITLKPDNQNTANSWKYVFKNLDRYPDYAKSQDNPYEYRVVEVVKEGETYRELSTGDYFNDCFKVQSYNNGTNVSVDSSENSTKVDKTYTITNVYSPKTNIKITKVDASDEGVKLNDVEFTLEKQIPTSGTGSSFEVDSEFKPLTVTTSGTGDNAGIAEFKDLPDGRYRLTETKAKEGYSLLKDPIIIVIDRTGTTLVDNKNYTFGAAEDTKNTISLQISNRMKFFLPKTGGYGAMLFILCGMALVTLGCLIFFLINLRKEVQYSRLKRQRRNAIGK